MDSQPGLDFGRERSTLARGFLIFGLWTLFGVLSALQVFVRDLSGRPGATPLQVINIVWFYWAWAMVTPLVIRLAKQVARGSRPWPMRVAAGLPLAFLTMAVQSLLYVLIVTIRRDATLAQLPANAADVFVRHAAGDLLTLATIVGGYVVFRYYQETQARLLQARDLEASLTAARLDTLKTQLQPHFLFNTLNLISALVAKGDADGATRAIARLGDLLRETLSSGANQTVPLEHELEVTGRYLDIARLRFGDRLQVHQRTDEGLATARVPALLLQPLVENALQHGIAHRERGGSIWIDVESVADGARLRLTVADDGPGFNGKGSGGLGLANTRARLTHLYGNQATLEATDREGGGAVVRVELPIAP